LFWMTSKWLWSIALSWCTLAMQRGKVNAQLEQSRSELVTRSDFDTQNVHMLDMHYFICPPAEVPGLSY
jgi:hypothetical protein